LRTALLINWDSYPHYTSGGVYTWAKGLVDNIHDWDFVVLNQLSNPNANGDFKVPSNVKKVFGLPVFGTYRFEEYVDDGVPMYSRMAKTTDSTVEKTFLPLYREFLEVVMADRADASRFSELVGELHAFLMFYDSKKCFENPQVWDSFVDGIKADPVYREMKLRETLLNFRVLQRSLQVLSLQLPKIDLVHASLAWLPSLAGIAAKRENGCPLVVTEHGIAFRELVLYYNMFLYNQPSKIFWTKFTHNLVRAIYRSADLIVPVCHANEEWERNLGADPTKIRVIHNGVNVERFKPVQVENRDPRPTIVTVARISVFKDIANLIHATNFIRERMSNVQCLVYGDSTEQDYSKMCYELVESLNLSPNFKFMGGTKTPEKAYAAGDVVAFSSITEGFPFAVIEAMACGKAIVATDVGGVREALEGCGMIVRSRSPRDLALAIMRLLNDGDLRQRMGAAALIRARKEFDLNVSVRRYNDVYNELANAAEGTPRTVREKELLAR
jgi:polysaccharide biosynthesis protein PelF